MAAGGRGRPPTAPVATGWPATCSSVRRARTRAAAGILGPVEGRVADDRRGDRAGSSAEERAARRQRLHPRPAGRAARGVLAPAGQPRAASRPRATTPTWRSTRACPTAPGGARPPASGTSTAGPRAAQICGASSSRLDPRGPADLAPGFELSAAVLRHLLADPLLPDGAAAGRVAGSRPASGLRPLGPAVPAGACGRGDGAPERLRTSAPRGAAVPLLSRLVRPPVSPDAGRRRHERASR